MKKVFLVVQVLGSHGELEDCSHVCVYENRQDAEQFAGKIDGSVEEVEFFPEIPGAARPTTPALGCV